MFMANDSLLDCSNKTNKDTINVKEVTKIVSYTPRICIAYLDPSTTQIINTDNIYPSFYKELTADNTLSTKEIEARF